MLLELARWLQGLEDFFGLFGYLTFRGILAALTSLFLSLWWGPAVIRRLGQLKGGQPIRKDGPQSHFSKAGTPTMGGALILITVVAAVLMWGDLRNKYVWTVLLVMVAFGAGGAVFASHAGLVDALAPALRAGVRVLVKGSRGSAMDTIVKALLQREADEAGGNADAA